MFSRVQEPHKPLKMKCYFTNQEAKNGFSSKSRRRWNINDSGFLLSVFLINHKTLGNRLQWAFYKKQNHNVRHGQRHMRNRQGDGQY